jgi:hypothetical protein
MAADWRDKGPLADEARLGRKYDTECRRDGTADIFMFTAPHLGWRRADVTETRTGVDFAWQIKRLMDEDFIDAEKIILVPDILNTHIYCYLYKAFLLDEANRIMDKIDLFYAPNHGSWLNVAR